MFTNDKEELEFYRKLHRKMYAAIYIIDVNSYTIEWVNDNKILGDVLGLSQDEVLSQGEFIAAKLLENPDFNESVTLAIKQFNETPDISWAGVYRIRHAINNELNWVFYSTATLEVDTNGNPTKTVCVALDPRNIINTPKTLDDFIKYISFLRHKSLIQTFTKRQEEILQLILQGESAESIAKELGISKYTVSDHKKSLYKKLEVKNTKQLFAKAQMFGLIG